MQEDLLKSTIFPLMGKMLLGQASDEELRELDKACKAELAAHPNDRAEHDRWMAAEQIMQMLEREGAEFTTSESAELRAIFFRSADAFKTLGAMRKVRKVV